MKFIALEQVSARILSNQAASLNLSHLELCDSHIIDLLPTFSNLGNNITVDLSHNKITDFSAILLIRKLNTTQRLRLEYNNISTDFLKVLSNNVWKNDVEISFNTLGEIRVQVVQLSSFHKKDACDFNKLTEYFRDQMTTISQNPTLTKTTMLTFLLLCVRNWRSDYIHNQSYEQIVARNLLPNHYDSNRKHADLFNILVSSVNYAAEIERLINVYKNFIIQGTIQAESQLLKEIYSTIISINDSDLVEHEHYDSYDFICDIFDYFIKRYNEEIDNSLFYGTSPQWQEFIKNLRDFFSLHIDINRFDASEGKVHNIHVWEKVKSRSIFTLHRNKCLRLLSYLSGYMAGRTQTLINIDNAITFLQNGAAARVNPVIAAGEKAEDITNINLRLFKKQPDEAFTQLLSAIRIHDRTRVAQLLNNSDLIDSLDNDFWSPIHHWAASSAVDREILTLLIASKPEIIHDVISNTGWNAVFVIINNCAGDSAVKARKLELLCQYGIDCCIADKLSGKLPLHYAVIADQERLIESLFKLHPHTLETIDSDKKTPRDYALPGSVAETLLSLYQSYSEHEAKHDFKQ